MKYAHLQKKVSGSLEMYRDATLLEFFFSRAIVILSNIKEGILSSNRW